MPSEAVDSTSLNASPKRAATFFRHPFIAVLLGIVLPLVCLALDPIVFKAGFGAPMMPTLRIAAYALISLSMASLAAWLSLRRLPSLFCGFLGAGCVFASGLGIILLPMTFMGLLAFIGILGFSPFLTAAIYWHCARQARETAGARFKPLVAVLAFFLLFSVPVGVQAYIAHLTDRSIALLASDRDESVEEGIQRLEWLGPLFDPDTLVWRYSEAKSQPDRERVAKAYKTLTGGDIEDRLAWLLD